MRTAGSYGSRAVARSLGRSSCMAPKRARNSTIASESSRATPAPKLLGSRAVYAGAVLGMSDNGIRRCPVCWHRVMRTMNGLIGAHWDGIGAYCPGSSQPMSIAIRGRRRPAIFISEQEAS